MGTEIARIIGFVGQQLLHIWPYLLITIPVAVIVKISDGSRYINRALGGRPVIAIFLGTLVGAISPFCSCGVIPIVSSLLIGGVPLAPVMSFWIASPSMDPEMFFLSVSTLGWELALWRLAATFVISLGAGLVTHHLVKRDWLTDYVSIRHPGSSEFTLTNLLRRLWSAARSWARPATAPLAVSTITQFDTCCSDPLQAGISIGSEQHGNHPSLHFQPLPTASTVPDGQCDCPSDTPSTFRSRLLRETAAATLMVAKFMTLAFLIEAVIELYVPANWIALLVGKSNHWAILLTTLIGVPAYTSNLTALPMISGLLAQGMDRGAALAFLIAGPTTTLPAMAAVWGLVSRRVFVLYISIALSGALLVGYAYSLVQWIR